VLCDIGINEYSDPYLQRFSGETSPVEDVRSFEGLLELKFSRYHPQFVLKENPVNFELFDRKLTKFLSVKEYKDVLIYFSGHGYQILDEDSGKYRGYLATSDSILDMGDDDNPYAQRKGFSLNRLSDLISRATHLNSLTLFIDACHSGHAIKDGALSTSFLSLQTQGYFILKSAKTCLSP
jgi:hypothetical protein